MGDRPGGGGSTLANTARTLNQDEPHPAGQHRVSTLSISLPKGGAIRGIGEKFAPNPVTGTGLMTVPIAPAPGAPVLKWESTAACIQPVGIVFVLMGVRWSAFARRSMVPLRDVCCSLRSNVPMPCTLKWARTVNSSRVHRAAWRNCFRSRAQMEDGGVLIDRFTPGSRHSQRMERE